MLPRKETALADLQEGEPTSRRPALAQVSLDIEPDQLAEHERLNLQNWPSSTLTPNEAEMDVAQNTPQVTRSVRKPPRLRPICLLCPPRSRIPEAVTQISSRFEESKLPPDASEDSARLVAESRGRRRSSRATGLAAGIELAIDAATTAAALTRLLQNVLNKERAVTIAQRKRDEHVRG